MNKFKSTRNSNVLISGSEAILNGLADDGGLYIKENIINYNIEKLYNESLNDKNVSFKKIANTILTDFFDDIEKSELINAIDKAYNSFSLSDVTKTIKFGDDYLLELYYGKTSAFKDIALCLLPYLLTLSQKNLNINKLIYILCATSGDTGKAALEGFKNVDGTYITIFYPYKSVSQIQELQMLTTDGNNTNVVSLDSNFDVCQKIVKDIMNNRNDLLKNKNILFSSANSINIGRLAPQIIYYFKSYFDLISNMQINFNEQINFIVPTGNFGDILAGYYAKLMGLPINKLICASNKNNILTDFLTTGEYNINRDFYKTYAPSMDILISSNLERLLYISSNHDNELITNLMNKLNTEKKYTINKKLFDKISNTFIGFFTTDEDILFTIKDTFDNLKILIDPHTACAVNALKQYKNKYACNEKNIILSTASPYKFSNTVLKAIDSSKLSNNEFENMNIINKISKVDIPENLLNLKSQKIINCMNIKQNEALDYIKNKINNLEENL